MSGWGGDMRTPDGGIVEGDNMRVYDYEVDDVLSEIYLEKVIRKSIFQHDTEA